MSNQIQDIFEQACDLPTGQRSDYLQRVCGDRSSLRSEVESLLAAHDAAGGFLGQPTAAFVSPDTDDRVALGVEEGDTIGRYKLLQRIGEGGFGVVYMAQQLQPVKRKVALKIIKLGMDTKQVVARFEAERQALAMMDNPNIARVLDGGATATGRPYFVMELVRGDPVTEYCDRKRLSPRRRLELFQQVCGAVQHAHQKGIIHRDIKPSNVLVTVADDKPVVKVIDFGIAKATNSELTEKTLFTEFRQLIGTPEYMSPEQAERSGVDVDTRSDIYSLGVLLYEVLTGTTPFDAHRLRSAAWGTLQQIIRDEYPPPPSTRVSTLKDQLDSVARDREVEPAKLSAVLRGELDWIVMKAMEKDRTRRYATTAEFSDDIRRYLQDEPVTAGPPSTIYRWKKFARRHRGPLAAATIALAALVLGMVATTWTALWALEQRDKALAAENRATQETARARRFSALAGNMMLQPDQLNRSKAAWQREIESIKTTLPADDTERVRQECQYAAWLCTRGMLQDVEEYREESRAILADLYPRAKRVLGTSDINFFGLANAQIQSMVVAKEKPQQLVPYYEDLMDSMLNIYGESHVITREIVLEFAVLHMKAGNLDKSVEQFDRYFRLNEATEEYSMTHLWRIKLAKRTIDQQTPDGEEPEVFQRVRDLHREQIEKQAGNDDIPSVADVF